MLSGRERSRGGVNWEEAEGMEGWASFIEQILEEGRWDTSGMWLALEGVVGVDISTGTVNWNSYY